MSLSAINAAYCQIACESFLSTVPFIQGPVFPGTPVSLTQAYDGSALQEALISGNGIYTTLTPSQAEQFSEQYQVLFTYPNDATGLSFSVFGVKDANGQLTGEKVLSIRSTECDPTTLEGESRIVRICALYRI